MNVGDEIYIPLTPLAEYGGINMIFEFTFENATTWSKIVEGSNIEMGKVHPISFNLI